MKTALFYLSKYVFIVSFSFFILSCRGEVSTPVPTVTPSESAVTGGGEAAATGVPNITRSIFQDPDISFECLKSVFDTAKTVQSKIILPPELENCAIKSVIAQESVLTLKPLSSDAGAQLESIPSGDGHVFSSESLAADFVTYRNGIGVVGSNFDKDLLVSQDVQKRLQCDKVKKIGSNELGIFTAGIACGPNLSYEFILCLKCTEQVSIPLPAPVINSTSPISFTCRKATNRFQDPTLSFPDDIDFFGFSRPGSFNQNLIERAEGSEIGGKLVIKAISSMTAISGAGVSFDDRQNISKISTVGGQSSFAFLDDGTPLSNNGMITKSPGGATLSVSEQIEFIFLPLLDGFEIRIPKKVLDEIPFRHLIAFVNSKALLSPLQTVAIFCVLEPVSPLQ